MKAMVLERPGTPLRRLELPTPSPSAGEVLVKVTACGVCRTDLHVVDGDLKDPKLPVMPGHEIVGRVCGVGAGVAQLRIGERVGIPWLGYTCGTCRYCQTGRENLCDAPGFTGYQLDGGYADYAVADARYCFPIPGAEPDAEVAPWLCAGLIGHRSLRLAGDAETIGIYGFGAAAHLVTQSARYQGRRVYAFTRCGDRKAQEFATSLGCAWAGGSGEMPPTELDAAIIFAPVGNLVPTALRAVRKGGTVVLGGIHMGDIPAFPYEIIWGERVVRSVANLTRNDALEFLQLAPKVPVRSHIVTLPLTEANVALDRLRAGELTGAAVLMP
jgi:alcohol dehydrogenase, propanol-preferring